MRVSAGGGLQPFHSPLPKNIPSILYHDRFAETQAMALLCYFLLRYKVTVTEEPQFAGEMFEQKKERVLRATVGITLT